MTVMPDLSFTCPRCGTYYPDIIVADATRDDDDGVCPKCHTRFERPANPNPAGYLCPECRRLHFAVVGVVYFRTETEFYADNI